MAKRVSNDEERIRKIVKESLNMLNDIVEETDFTSFRERPSSKKYSFIEDNIDLINELANSYGFEFVLEDSDLRKNEIRIKKL